MSELIGGYKQCDENEITCTSDKTSLFLHSLNVNNLAAVNGWLSYLDIANIEHLFLYYYFPKYFNLTNYLVDFVNSCKIYSQDMLCAIVRRMFNFNKIYRSYSDLHFFASLQLRHAIPHMHSI